MIAFKPENFRTLVDGDAVPSKIRLMNKSPLMLIKTSGEAMYGRTRGEKDDLVARFASDDLLLWAWSGQWGTDVFRLTKDDLEKYYR